MGRSVPPPIGRHRYIHALYAPDCVLPDLGAPTATALTAPTRGRELARARLIGISQRG